jgi:hypothetical protein
VEEGTDTRSLLDIAEGVLAQHARERHRLIGEEIAAHREAWGKVRGLLRVALRRNTKADFSHGCLAVLSLADTVSPVGRGDHGARAGALDVEPHTDP